MGHFRPIDNVYAMSAFTPIATDSLHYGNGRKGPTADVPISRPQPRLRVPEFWQQPRRCHVCPQSRIRRSRLQLPVFPRLWPLFRCEEEFPDNKQRQEGAARMHGFVRLSSRSPHGRTLRPPTRYGSVPYRASRAACVPENAADRSETSLQEHSSHHPQIRSPRCDPIR